MPDLLAHYALSILVAKTRFNTKKALLLGVIGVLPDVDVLFRVHRWITHSILVATLVALLALFLAYRYRRKYFEYTLIAVVLYLFHILLDVFNAPTPILWPLLNQSYSVTIGLDGLLVRDGFALKPKIEVVVDTVDFIQLEYMEGPVVGEAGLMAGVTLVFILVIEVLERCFRGSKRYSYLLT